MSAPVRVSDVPVLPVGMSVETAYKYSFGSVFSYAFLDVK